MYERNSELLTGQHTRYFHKPPMSDFAFALGSEYCLQTSPFSVACSTFPRAAGAVGWRCPLPAASLAHATPGSCCPLSPELGRDPQRWGHGVPRPPLKPLKASPKEQRGWKQGLLLGLGVPGLGTGRGTSGVEGKGKQ